MVSPHSFPAQEISGRKALLRVVQRAKVAKKKVRIKNWRGLAEKWWIFWWILKD